MVTHLQAKQKKHNLPYTKSILIIWNFLRKLSSPGWLSSAVEFTSLGWSPSMMELTSLGWLLSLQDLTLSRLPLFVEELTSLGWSQSMGKLIPLT